jgi:hypothetical protein
MDAAVGLLCSHARYGHLLYAIWSCMQAWDACVILDAGPGLLDPHQKKKRTSRIMHAALRFPDIRAHADVMLPDLCVSMQHAEILGED